MTANELQDRTLDALDARPSRRRTWVWFTMATLAVMGPLTGILLWSQCSMIAVEMQEYCNSRVEELRDHLEQARAEVQRTAEIIYEEVVSETDAAALLAQAETSAAAADAARQALFERVQPAYERLQGKVLKHLQFHTANNRSFLRMHMPDRYGDDLTEARATVRQANATQKMVCGFEEGRIFNGFRVVMPMSYHGRHVGAVEASSSSSAVLQRIDRTMDLVAFVIRKEVVEAKVFAEYQDNYRPCPLADGFMVEDSEYIRTKHLPERLDQLLSKNGQVRMQQAISKLITEADTNGKADYISDGGTTILAVFIPVANTEGEVVAAVVGLEHSRVLTGLSHMRQNQTTAILLGAAATAACIVMFGMAFRRSRATTELMRRLVQTDRLTGLASRSRLIDRMDLALARTKRTGKMCAVLFFDFDRFKSVNDSLGHDMGDCLLCSIADRLKDAVREVDTVARIGGDEFVILLEDLPDARAASLIANALLKACAQPHAIDGHRLVSTPSIGVVTNAQCKDGTKGMLRDADAAMYQAKTAGRARVVEFDSAMHEQSLTKLTLELALREALKSGELTLHYQPIIEIETDKATGAEALARWTHPVRGPISPGEFIPIAEESGQIQLLGDWVFHETCRQLASWREQGVVEPDFSISVNVSRVQLLEPHLADRLNKYIAHYGLRYCDLRLEVTETSIVDNRSGIGEVLRGLQHDGFIIVMDDFGTGQSSLSGLVDLPIDELKIDQSFINMATSSREQMAIMSSIFTLADHLSHPTVGEGVETAEQASLLLDLGCTKAQGYYFSRPLPSEEFIVWYTARNQHVAA